MPEDVLAWLKFLDAKEAKSPQNIFSPETLSDYVGQARAKRLVEIMVGAALKDKRPLPNILISGPFGQGKSALAHIIVNMMGQKIPTLDAMAVNQTMPSGTVVIDEIHNLEAQVCDSLNMLLDQNKIHIIGCTTNPGKLPAAFRSRFRNIHLDQYSVDDIFLIIEKYLKDKRSLTLNSVISNIAERSRRNPRTAINYLSMITDLMSVREAKTLTINLVSEAFKEMGVDEKGLQIRDYAYLNALPDRPVGLQYISSRISVDIKTIEEEIEPYLMQIGLIDRTPRGRIRV